MLAGSGFSPAAAEEPAQETKESAETAEKTEAAYMRRGKLSQPAYQGREPQTSRDETK